MAFKISCEKKHFWMKNIHAINQIHNKFVCAFNASNWAMSRMWVRHICYVQMEFDGEGISVKKSVPEARKMLFCLYHFKWIGVCLWRCLSMFICMFFAIGISCLRSFYNENVIETLAHSIDTENQLVGNANPLLVCMCCEAIDVRTVNRRIRKSVFSLSQWTPLEILVNMFDGLVATHSQENVKNRTKCEMHSPKLNMWHRETVT